MFKKVAFVKEIIRNYFTAELYHHVYVLRWKQFKVDNLCISHI